MTNATLINENVTNAQESASARNDFLKLFAMVTMLIDHIGHMHLVSQSMYILFRSIGRLAFPIFAYQIAVGYSKTTNLKKYVQRLILFALVSQVPYFFFNQNLKFELFHLNIMFTLLAGLGLIHLYEKGKSYYSEFKETNNSKSLYLSIAIYLCIFIALILPEIIKFTLLEKYQINFSFEYGTYGLLMILFFHIFRQNKLMMIISYIILSFVGVYVTSITILVNQGLQIIGRNISALEAMFEFDVLHKIMIYQSKHLNLSGIWLQARSILSLGFIYLLESPKFNLKLRFNKYIGYWFYPVHITVLLIIAYIIK